MYQRYILSVVAESLSGFKTLFDDKPGENESMEGYELGLTAWIVNCNPISSSTELPECLTALMIVSISDTCASHGVSMLAATASTSDIKDVATATNEQCLQ